MIFLFDKRLDGYTKCDLFIMQFGILGSLIWICLLVFSDIDRRNSALGLLASATGSVACAASAEKRLKKIGLEINDVM